MAWDDLDDEEANAWARAHNNYVKRGRWLTIDVEFECRQGFVTITKDEWELYQKFLAEYDICENRTLTYDIYSYLPHKVRLLIEDWIRHLSGHRSRKERD